MKLYVTLPLLSAALNSSNQVWRTIDSASLEALRSMATWLAQFSISSDHGAQTRSAALSCLFTILLHGNQDDGYDSLFHTLLDEGHSALTDLMTFLKKEVSASTSGAYGSLLQSPKSLHSALSQVEDIFSFLGVLVRCSFFHSVILHFFSVPLNEISTISPMVRVQQLLAKEDLLLKLQTRLVFF